MRGDVGACELRRDGRWGSPPRARGRRFRGRLGAGTTGLTPACAGTSRRGQDDWQRFQGSPPRARGRRLVAHQPLACVGLTPACAGTSWRLRRSGGRRRAHPRVRGDVATRAMMTIPIGGSPPRARGRRAVELAELRGEGLTPACAGTSPVTSSGCSTARGSPPRARGRPASRSLQGPSFGLTPACAGTSRRGVGRVLAVGAHPRVRGDVRRRWRPMPSARGSPPRARGRHSELRCEVMHRGLTPACAGTSGLGVGGAFRARAHPRVRGDVQRGRLGRLCSQGSPPRARGRRQPRARDRDDGGLTPACAGTSRAPRLAWRGCWAHPRVRGDVNNTTTLANAAGGSPPRARGRRGLRRPRRIWAGLTPACAGTSCR